MTEIAQLFAEVTAVLEDMHGVAVEGQANELPEAMTAALVISLCADIDRLGEKLTTISLKAAKT